MISETIVQAAADAAANRIRGGESFTDAVRAALRKRNIPKGSWSEYFTAVAAELGRRGREMRPVKPPAETPSETKAPALSSARERQLGFGFDEDEQRTPRRRAA